MNKNDIEKCEKLISLWKECPEGIKKDNIRNEIFSIMNISMYQWVSSVLAKKGDWQTPEEITSKSWECFEYGLIYYCPQKGIPLPNHFYAYTKFCLSLPIVSLSTTPLDNNEKSGDIYRYGDGGDLMVVYDHVEELKTFRNTLPQDYHSIFDDALMSMVPNTRERLQRLNKTPLGLARYQECKKIFKIIIEFLLIR